MCTKGCLDFWKPLSVSGNTAPNVAGVTFGTAKRPDGKTQVTYQGKPLYTFKLDKAPGDMQGDDFTDKFGGTTFTWHAATIGGGGNAPAPAPTDSGGGNPYGY
jgi:predicted lipoprotein with Yx(FWY)xxD motif